MNTLTKNWFVEGWIDFEYKKYMLDEDFSRDQFMEKFPTARTFPQILIDGKLIGGYTEFAAEVGIE